MRFNIHERMIATCARCDKPIRFQFSRRHKIDNSYLQSHNAFSDRQPTKRNLEILYSRVLIPRNLDLS